MVGRVGKPTGLSSPTEPSSTVSALTGFDPSHSKVCAVDGVAYILPLSEGNPSFVRKFGSFGVGLGFRWSSFGFGLDVLSAGILLMIGPAFVWVAHIERQLTAYERDYLASAIEARRAETENTGSVHESAADAQTTPQSTREPGHLANNQPGTDK